MPVLNPMGFPPAIPPQPLARRLATLDGKTIYLVDCRFDDSLLLLEQLQAGFTDHLPTVTTRLVQLASMYSRDDPELWHTIKQNGDAAILGVGH
ncbi:MAG: hypothetical protein NVSMB2_22790 [Chloroflexota bacterium]